VLLLRFGAAAMLLGETSAQQAAYPVAYEEVRQEAAFE
jgi:hypothetical protein